MCAKHPYLPAPSAGAHLMAMLFENSTQYLYLFACSYLTCKCNNMSRLHHYDIYIYIWYIYIYIYNTQYIHAFPRGSTPGASSVQSFGWSRGSWRDSSARLPQIWRRTRWALNVATATGRRTWIRLLGLAGCLLAWLVGWLAV